MPHRTNLDYLSLVLYKSRPYPTYSCSFDPRLERRLSKAVKKIVPPTNHNCMLLRGSGTLGSMLPQVKGPNPVGRLPPLPDPRVSTRSWILGKTAGTQNVSESSRTPTCDKPRDMSPVARFPRSLVVKRSRARPRLGAEGHHALL